MRNPPDKQPNKGHRDRKKVKKVNEDSIKRIIHAIRIYLQRDELVKVEKALYELYSIGKSKGGGKLLMLNDVGELMIYILSRRSKNAQLAANCCQVIRQLEGNIVQYFKLGVPEHIINVMNLHKHDKNVQAGGLYALRRLAVYKPNAIALSGYIFRVDATIEQAMALHITNSEVQKAACSCIWALCAFEEVRTAFWRTNIVSCVITSLKTHKLESKIQQYGIMSLERFEQYYTLVHLGLAEIIIDAMLKHTRNKALVICGIRLIGRFSNYNVTATTLKRLEAPKILLDILSRCDKYKEIQFVGVNAIFKMSKRQQLKSEFPLGKLGRFFQNFFEIFNKPNDTQKLAISLVCLNSLLTTEYTVRQMLGLTIPRIITQLATDNLHENKVEIVDRCLDILLSFCKTLPEIKESISKETSNLVDLITRRYPYDKISKKAEELTFYS